MQHNGWDHALTVSAGGTGLVGHAGAVLLRKAADQAGLTAGLSAAFREKKTSPLLDRGIVLVSMAAAIALGATSMSDIAVLAHLAPVLGAAPSGPTVRRALGLAGGTSMLERAAKARARARAHVRELLSGMPGGFPWLVIAGKTLAGWLVIDMDATLVTARSDKEGAAPAWKNSLNFWISGVGAGWDAELDGLSGSGAGHLLDLGEFGAGSGEADLEAFDFAEPSFAAGFFDPGQQVLADIEEALALGWVGA